MAKPDQIKENTEEQVTGEVKETAPKKPAEITYEDREQLDAALSGVIADILSAEQEAKHIIAKAEENAKAIQLDGATQARSMREVSSRVIAEAREQKNADALKREEAEKAKRIEQATAQGDKLLKEKSKQITEQINKLFTSIGGKA